MGISIQVFPRRAGGPLPYVLVQPQQTVLRASRLALVLKCLSTAEDSCLRIRSAESFKRSNYADSHKNHIDLSFSVACDLRIPGGANFCSLDTIK